MSLTVQIDRLHAKAPDVGLFVQSATPSNDPVMAKGNMAAGRSAQLVVSMEMCFVRTMPRLLLGSIAWHLKQACHSLLLL